MKIKTFTFFLLLLSCCQWLVGQCPQSNLTFSTQAQVDSFRINYPDCTETLGKVTVSGEDITNLDSFNIIQKASGFLIKDNPNLSNLAGLENLYEAGAGCEEGFKIENNDALVNLEGLNNLSVLSHGLTILDNDGLLSLSGLESLDTIYDCPVFDDVTRGYLSIASNDNLESISGLEGLKSVYRIEIVDNDLLSSLEELQSIDTLGSLVINEQDAFTSLEGLPNLDRLGNLSIRNNSFLKSVDGIEKIGSLLNLSIINNDSLISLGEADLISIDSSAGRVIISGNEQLVSIEGLNSLEAVAGLEISDNPSLLSLHGLQSLERGRLLGCCFRGCNNCLGHGDIKILNNDNLTDLSGLENLKFVSWLDIIDNDNLVTLSGLNSLISVSLAPPLSGLSGIWIENNSLLSDCASPVICNLVHSIQSIEGNLSGCNNIAEIESLCVSIPPPTPVLLSPLNGITEEPGAISLKWYTLASADSYAVQMSIDPGFSSFVVDAINISEDSIMTPSLAMNTTYYWRVKALNAAGDSNWSEVWSFTSTMMTGTKELEQDAFVKLHPNPTTDQLQVQTLNNTHIESIRFYDTTGQRVKQINFPGSTIDVSEIPPGFYFVKIETANRYCFVKLVIK